VRADAHPGRPGAAATLSIEDLAQRSGFASEHVVLASEQDAHSAARVRSGAVRRRCKLHNRVRGTVTGLRIYTDGTLTVTRRRRGQPPTEQILDLRFLDSSPTLSRQVAKKLGRTALALAAITIATGLIGGLSVWPTVMLSVAATSAAAAVVLSILFVRRSYERVEFRTLHGQAAALRLTANFGCQRAYRRAVPILVAAIRQAQHEQAGTKPELLREEIREHYRLAAAGHITAEDCSAATRRILKRFG